MEGKPIVSGAEKDFMSVFRELTAGETATRQQAEGADVHLIRERMLAKAKVLTLLEKRGLANDDVTSLREKCSAALQDIDHILKELE